MAAAAKMDRMTNVTISSIRVTPCRQQGLLNNNARGPDLRIDISSRAVFQCRGFINQVRNTGLERVQHNARERSFPFRTGAVCEYERYPEYSFCFIHIGLNVSRLKIHRLAAHELYQLRVK